MTLCGALSACAVMALLASSFRRLVVAQFEAGPSRTVVRDEPRAHNPRAELDEEAGRNGGIMRPRQRLLVGAGSVQACGQTCTTLSNFLGGGVQVPVSARPRSDGGAVIAIDRAVEIGYAASA